jgi:hypothetical protein
MAYEISTRVEIAATPENVWAVLADLPSYSQWHPVYRSVTGELAPGSKLVIKTVVPSSGDLMTVKVKVLTVKPGVELRWVSKMLGIPISKRTFLLGPSDGRTLLVQEERYRGLVGGRSTINVVGRIQGTFVAINEAIKEQAEARQQAPG